MKLNHRLLIATAAVLGLAAPVVAGAQSYVTATPKESGFYVGALVGYSSIDVAKSDWDTAVNDAFTSIGGNVTSSSLSKGDFAYGLNVGWQVMRNFAVEVGWLDLGKTKGTADGTVVSGGVTVPVSVRGDFKSSGPTGALIGILPFSDGWAIDGRIGGFYGDTKVQLTATSTGGSVSAEESKSKGSFLGGVGASWSFTPNSSVRLDYMYIDKVGDKNTTGEASVNLFSLGFRYLF